MKRAAGSHEGSSLTSSGEVREDDKAGGLEVAAETTRVS